MTEEQGGRVSLIDDTCDKCGRRYDPMGDPLLYRHPEIGPWAVFCGPCEYPSDPSDVG